MGIADEHRRIAGEFTATVEGTARPAWDHPAPPEGWVARDVVRHLVDERLRGVPAEGDNRHAEVAEPRASYSTMPAFSTLR